jgi:GNAT superfamily N-acetyltransferase
MNHELTIQRAQIEHAEALTAIALAAKRQWGYPERWMEIWVPSLTMTPAYIAHHETWMALLDEEPVAFYSLKQDADAWWLDNLWVRPDAMGQGIGATLVRHAKRRVRRVGASALRVESDPNAVGFYVKMGARKVDERRTEVDGQARILPIFEIGL